MAPKNRPLSPHLQIYRPQITSFLSIVHRLTGVALAGGAIIFTYWIVSATYGPEAFATAQWLLGSWIGRLVLFGLTFSMYFHLANGVRHVAWDIGYGFELPTLRKSGVGVVIFSIVMTLITFVIAYS